jgi:hypothetical protein
MKKNIHTLFLVAVTCALWFTASVALAQTGGTPGATIGNPLKVETLECFIAEALKVVVNIGAIVCVFFIIYSGFLFVTAQGNEAKLTQAKNTFLYTVIGTAILLGAWVLALVISGTIGKILNTNYQFRGCATTSMVSGASQFAFTKSNQVQQ